MNARYAAAIDLSGRSAGFALMKDQELLCAASRPMRGRRSTRRSAAREADVFGKNIACRAVRKTHSVPLGIARIRYRDGRAGSDDPLRAVICTGAGAEIDIFRRFGGDLLRRDRKRHCRSEQQRGKQQRRTLSDHTFSVLHLFSLILKNPKFDLF